MMKAPRAMIAMPVVMRGVVKSRPRVIDVGTHEGPTPQVHEGDLDVHLADDEDQHP